MDKGHVCGVAVDLFHNIVMGFGVTLTPNNLLACFIGVSLGTFIGVLPGIGPLATIAILLPITYYMPAVPSLIMLAGVYYGAMYGGGISAILLNIPGEASAAVACLDGHEMAKQGRAGPALGISALSSFFAGCVGTLLIALFAVPLANVALDFTSPEYFSLVVLGLVCAVVLAHGSLMKAIPMVLIGLLLGMVGIDVNSGMLRFTFGIPELEDGLDFVVLAMGLFGIAEIIKNIDSPRSQTTHSTNIRSLLPSRLDFLQCWKSVLRGTGIGAFIGILPGAGVSVASFSAYALEKKVAKQPSRFGHGAPEGLAAPEAANNAAAQTSMIPTLTLGIPGSATMAVMLGAMMIQGITPGPQVMIKYPDLFWGMIASMWIGNLFLVILNLPMIGIWTRLLMIPYRMLYPAILLFCAIGVFSVHSNPFDIITLALVGVCGYVFVKLQCEPAPLLLGYILGPMMEENLRRSLLLSQGDPMIFLTRPISLGFLIATAALLLWAIVPALKGKKERASSDEEIQELISPESSG